MASVCSCLSRVQRRIAAALLISLSLLTTGAHAAAAPEAKAAAVAVLTPQQAAASNPLFEAGPFPQWERIKPDHIMPAVTQLIAEEAASLDLLEQDLAKAVKDGTVAFDRVFLPLAQIRLRLDAVYGQIDHLSGVTDSEALRDAVDAISPERVAFELRLGQSKDVYYALNALNSTEVRSGLSAEQQRLLDKTLGDYKDSGVGLSPQRRAQFNAIVDKLQKLSTNYTNNVLDSTKAFKLVLTSKQQVDGLERSTLAVAAQKAKAAGYKNASTDDGPWLITLDTPTYSAIMAFSKDRELRRKVFQAYRGLASAGEVDNSPLTVQILTLRKELAQMLGYNNYAEQSLSGKMATLSQANQLLDQVSKESRPAVIQEDAQLTAFARQQTGDPKLELEWWDTSYWSERQKEKLFDFRQEELKEYLTLDSVLDGLFKLAKRLYGIEIQPAKGNFSVWHEDVKVYAISDPGSSKPIAYFYTDFYSRPGQKQGGAWVQGFWDRAQYRRQASPAALQAAKQGTLFKASAAAAAAAAAAAKQNNSSTSNAARVIQWSQSLADQTSNWLKSAPMQVPLALVVTNQDPPADGKPSLMTLGGAETLFHEFGHALQHLLTQSKQALTSGMRDIEWDAVETPSQMQEKWVYDNGTFNSFAKHWKTGKQVPASMFDKIKRLQTYRSGNAFAFQLTLGKTDLQLHSSFNATGKTTPNDVYLALYGNNMPHAPYSGDMMMNNFGHIFAGGYGAGYYSYIWADVMSADAFAAFLEVGTDNDKEVEKLGRLFRNTFLSAGGSVPPGQVFKAFRGREPQVQPLLDYYGLG